MVPTRRTSHRDRAVQVAPAFFVFITLFFFAPLAHAAYEISNGSVKALYHLEGLTDSSGNGYDLINNGSVAFPSGKFSNAADGTATNTARYLSTSNTFGIDGGSSSISVWVNITTPISSSPSTYTFLDQRNNTSDAGYSIRYVWNGGTPQLQWVRQKVGVADDQVTENITLSTSTWYHLVLTYDGSSVAGWRNGVSKGSVSSTGNGNTNSTEGFTVLAYTGAANFVSGLVDEAVITNTAISTSTISALYNGGSGQEVCVTSGCGSSTSTPTFSSSSQLKADGVTTLAEGDSTTETSVVFKAFLNSSSSNNLQFQIQLSTSTSFNNVRTATSSSVSPGNYATTTITAIEGGSYYWRGRALDTITSATSTWQQFGTVDVVDFTATSTTSAFVEIFGGSVKALYHLEDVFDASGNSYTLTNNNSTPFSSGRLSNAGDGGASNGSKHFSTSNTLDLSGGNASISIWVNITSQINGGTYTFFDQRNDSNDTGYTIRYVYNGGNRQLQWTRERLGSGDDQVTENVTLSTGTWYHLALTYDGSNIRAYRDGSEVPNSPVASTGIGSGSFTSGAYLLSYVTSGGGNFTSGLIDEVVVTNTALSSSTIVALYNNNSGKEACAQPSGCGGILQGTIASSSVWTRADSPFVVTSTVTVNSGVTVAVEPGAVIKFKDDQSLIINGEFDVRGTTSSMVYFTSYHDDSVGGDMENNSSTGAAGDWGHIQVNSGASTTFAGTVVRYGGNASSSANVYNAGGMLNIRTSDISYGSTHGLYLSAGATTISNSQIHNNYNGIRIDQVSVNVTSSFIFANASSGYGASQTFGPTSTMENNFWGGWYPLDELNTSTQNSGPYHSILNSGGAGDDASDYVDFTPYNEAYLSPLAAIDYQWSPPAVSSTDNGYPYLLRVGSSTQYQAQLEEAIDIWNASTSINVMTLVKGSSTPSSSWDLHVADINDPAEQFGGRYFPATSTANRPYILFNIYIMSSSSTTENGRKCTTIHELGHALGLAHSPSTNDVMYTTCGVSQRTALGAQDKHDFDLLWDPSYFFDPHRMKQIIRW